MLYNKNIKSYVVGEIIATSYKDSEVTTEEEL